MIFRELVPPTTTSVMTRKIERYPGMVSHKDKEQTEWVPGGSSEIRGLHKVFVGEELSWIGN